MSTYRTIKRTVEAMQIPERGSDERDARKVAVWMIENGYEDQGDNDPGDFSADELHNGQVLPEWGTNFLTFFDSFGDNEITAREGDWIIQGDQEWAVMDSIEFSNTYEPAAAS